MSDYYELLGVSRSATEDEIKRSYRRLARELHPDANGGDPASEARFKEVSTAYETLRDPERRRRYDLLGPDGVRSGGSAEGFGGGIGDIFEAFFGQGSPFGGAQGGRNGSAVRRGSDAEILLELDFAEAVFGTRREVTVRGPVPCSVCQASGAQPGTSASKCIQCAGSGEVHRVRQSILGQMVTSAPCDRCGGSGEVVSSPCHACRGEGRRVEDRVVPLEVPAGVDEGATLRVSGAGSAALRGGVAGDLYVHLRIQPDRRFERVGADLVTELHITMAQAALGFEAELETLEGPESLSIPAGTEPGKVVRLRGRGVPHLRSKGRGDLLVRIAVDIPTKLAKDEEELLRRFAELRGEAVAAPEGGLLSRLRSSFS